MGGFAHVASSDVADRWGWIQIRAARRRLPRDGGRDNLPTLFVLQICRALFHLQQLTPLLSGSRPLQSAWTGCGFRRDYRRYSKGLGLTDTPADHKGFSRHPPFKGA